LSTSIKFGYNQTIIDLLREEIEEFQQTSHTEAGKKSIRVKNVLKPTGEN
jgi:hypothetical protein